MMATHHINDTSGLGNKYNPAPLTFQAARQLINVNPAKMHKYLHRLYSLANKQLQDSYEINVNNNHDTFTSQ